MEDREIEDCIKSNFIWTAGWLEDIVRENANLIDDEIRDALEVIILMNKSMMAEYEVSSDDIKRLETVRSCFICNKAFDHPGSRILHGIVHLEAILKDKHKSALSDFNLIVTWVSIYSDTMEITKKVTKIMEDSEVIIQRNVKKMNELYQMISKIK